MNTKLADETDVTLSESIPLGSTLSGPRKSADRLTVAEKAFARGFKALRERNYSEARRQLDGFLELTEQNIRSGADKSALYLPHGLQGMRVVVEALELLLAISAEITILEKAGR